MKVVNIYNKGLIPWLNIMGPVYNIAIGDSIYRLLARDGRVDIELSAVAAARRAAELQKEESKKSQETEEKSEPAQKSFYQELLEQEQAKAAKIQDQINGEPVKPETESTPVEDVTAVEEETQEVKKEEDATLKFEDTVEISDSVSEEETVQEEVADTVVLEEAENDIDAIIDSFADVEVDSFEVKPEAVVNAANKMEMKKYSKKALQNMTKAQMKEILIERGFTEGEFAPKYHDTVTKLINKILTTQK